MNSIIKNIDYNKCSRSATMIFCLFAQITISTLDCDFDYINQEQYILGITMICFSESVITGSLFFNYKLIGTISWTFFCLKTIGMALIFNKNPHQLILFASCLLSQFVYLAQFMNNAESSEIQHTYNKVNGIIQQFLDSQSKWSKQMKTRLLFIQTIRTNSNLTLKEQFQIEKILTYNVNSDMWASKFNNYILQLTKVYKDQFLSSQEINHKLKNNFQILASRLNSYAKKLEDEHSLYKDICELTYKDKNQFTIDSLSALDTIRNSQSKIIDWLTSEEINLNETINALIKQVEQIKDSISQKEQQQLELPINQFLDLIMSLNFDKQQLIYNLLQQQTDLRQLKHKYIRRLNKIKVFQQKQKQLPKFEDKEIEHNQLLNIEVNFKQKLMNLLHAEKLESQERTIQDIITEIQKIGIEKQKLENENLSLRGLLIQTESSSMFEESQRLLTKNDESFTLSQNCSKR